MIDKKFEKELIAKLKMRRVNVYRQKKYDRVYELLLRYCHDKNLDVAPLIWETMNKFLKAQMK